MTVATGLEPVIVVYEVAATVAPWINVVFKKRLVLLEFKSDIRQFR